MKHKVFITSALTFALLASPVMADVRADIRANIEVKRASTTERREDRREEVRNNIEQRKASSTERRLEMQVDIAKRKVEHVKKVILATIERLEKIIVRIESRIAKIKERGGNTTESEGFVATAKVNLSDAKVAVDAFAGLDLSGNTAAENFATIRAAAAEAKEHIRAAHENLKNAVRLLKSVGVNAEVQSSVETE